ncbi:type II toxin-antitoxin system VapC family toxin [uncultured Mucilaginibacter sp.]|uniref:type II toxin-antitoxin system VapC family toxin n=1 Tax=uncultured Mucilaginibacter sp. TaxID=797541 RepID=UPI0026043CA6|nr:type II toxin-antitoxin system VapC family toxin [uncultured Mucilaginibacter sp.]
MRYLIDTHVLIWYLEGSDKLPQKLREELDNDQNTILISVASFWELAIKISAKKIELTKSLQEVQAYIVERAFVFLNISFEHLYTLLDLPHHHKDPFDRMLIAQSITENIAIISVDQQFKPYSVNVIW